MRMIKIGNTWFNPSAIVSVKPTNTKNNHNSIMTLGSGIVEVKEPPEQLAGRISDAMTAEGSGDDS